MEQNFVVGAVTTAAVSAMGLIYYMTHKKQEFPELPAEALQLIRTAWESKIPLNQVFVKGISDITRKDLLTLRNGEWLNDSVITFYLHLVVERSTKNSDLPKVHAFSTFFYTTLEEKGHAGVKCWTRKVDIFSKDILLLPVHLEDHWCMAIVDFGLKSIYYYDSLGNSNNHCLDVIASYLNDESSSRKGVPFSAATWKKSCPKKIPRQVTNFDCGVFACKFADYGSRRTKMSFKQKDMPYFRERMVWEICTKTLLD